MVISFSLKLNAGMFSTDNSSFITTSNKTTDYVSDLETKCEKKNKSPDDLINIMITVSQLNVVVPIKTYL